MSESTSNPYAAPSVAQTLYAPEEDTIFVHRTTSRNLWSVLGSLPLLIGTMVITANVYGLLTEPSPSVSSSQEVALGIGIACLFLGFSAYVVMGFISPRVWEFRVNRQFVSWRKPWPSARENQIAVSSIDRVEFHGNVLMIVTLEGERDYPPVHSYGGAVESAIEAIKVAVRDRDPSTLVRERRTTESVSLMRRLGRVVASIGRLFRRK